MRDELQFQQATLRHRMDAWGSGEIWGQKSYCLRSRAGHPQRRKGLDFDSMSSIAEMHVVSRIADDRDELELSVVMPCLDEAATVGICVKKAIDALERHGIRGEVIVADNGSTDGSQQIASDFGARVVPVEKRGYGSALQAGIAAARGQFVLMGDADDTYDFSQLDEFVAKLREGYDLVMGNRFRGKILPGAMPALHRYLGNPVLTGLGRLFFKSPVGDFHCGLRAFRKDEIEQLELRTLGMEFASEMIVKATAFGLRVTEIPTTLAPDRRDRAPHLRTWRDGWRHLRFLLLYSPRWLFLYPGIALVAFGMVVSAALLPGPRKIGNVVFDIHTLLFAAMAILIGFQSVVFATFTKIFAISEGLLPEDPRLTRMFLYITLEVGLVAGVLLILAGSGAWMLGLEYWRIRQFGPLDPEKTLRIVIPGVVCFTLGFQVVLSSFFLSVLGMSRR
jgi:glycosyltransferase involved in cell wall biosynthesis